MPELPTVAELAGGPRYQQLPVGLMAPAGTPKQIVKKLSDATTAPQGTEHDGEIVQSGRRSGGRLAGTICGRHLQRNRAVEKARGLGAY